MQETNKIFVGITNMTANQLEAFMQIIRYQFKYLDASRTGYFKSMNDIDYTSEATITEIFKLLDEATKEDTNAEDRILKLLNDITNSESVNNNSLEISSYYSTANPSFNMLLRSIISNTDIPSTLDTYERKYISNNIKDYFKNKDTNKWIMVNSLFDSEDCTYSDWAEAIFKCGKFSEGFIFRTIDLLYNGNTSMMFHSNETFGNFKQSFIEKYALSASESRDFFTAISKVYGDIYKKILENTNEYSDEYIRETEQTSDNELNSFDSFDDLFNTFVSDEEYKRVIDDYNISDEDMRLMHLITALLTIYNENARAYIKIPAEELEKKFDSVKDGYNELSLVKAYTSGNVFVNKAPKAFDNVDFSSIWEFVENRAEKLAKAFKGVYPSEILNSDNYKLWLFNTDETIASYNLKLKVLMMYLDYNKYDKSIIYNNLEKEVNELCDQSNPDAGLNTGLVQGISAESFMNDSIAISDASPRVLATLLLHNRIKDSLSQVSLQLLRDTLDKYDIKYINEESLALGILLMWLTDNINETLNHELEIGYTKFVLEDTYNTDGITGLIDLRKHMFNKIIVYTKDSQSTLDNILLPVANKAKDILSEGITIDHEVNDTYIKLLPLLIREMAKFDGRSILKPSVDQVLPRTLVTYMANDISKTETEKSAYAKLLKDLTDYLEQYEESIKPIIKSHGLDKESILHGRNITRIMYVSLIPRVNYRAYYEDTIYFEFALALEWVKTHTDKEGLFNRLDKIYTYFDNDYELETTTLDKALVPIFYIVGLSSDKIYKQLVNVDESTDDNVADAQDIDTSTPDNEIDELESDEKTIMISYLNSEYETVRKFIGPFYDSDGEAYESFKQMLDDCRCSRRKYNDGYYEVVELAHIWDSLHNGDVEIPNSIKQVVDRIQFKFEKNEDGKDMTIRAWAEE